VEEVVSVFPQCKLRRPAVPALQSQHHLTGRAERCRSG
jgi:hypothetical protein